MDCNDKQSHSKAFPTSWGGKLYVFTHTKLWIPSGKAHGRSECKFLKVTLVCTCAFKTTMMVWDCRVCLCAALFISSHRGSKQQSYISSLSNEPHVYQTRMIALVVMSQTHNERGGVKWRENESRNMTAHILHREASSRGEREKHPETNTAEGRSWTHSGPDGCAGVVKHFVHQIDLRQMICYWFFFRST